MNVEVRYFLCCLTVFLCLNRIAMVEDGKTQAMLTEVLGKQARENLEARYSQENKQACFRLLEESPKAVCPAGVQYVSVESINYSR
jgi:hypothetical protein